MSWKLVLRCVQMKKAALITQMQLGENYYQWVYLGPAHTFREQESHPGIILFHTLPLLLFPVH